MAAAVNRRIKTLLGVVVKNGRKIKVLSDLQPERTIILRFVIVKYMLGRYCSTSKL